MHPRVCILLYCIAEGSVAYHLNALPGIHAVMRSEAAMVTPMCAGFSTT